MVVADQLHNGSRHLTLRSAEGASFLIPVWMIDPETASVKIVDIPRISIARLLDLRAFLDSGLAFGSGNRSPKEALMANHGTRTQGDLFDRPLPDLELGARERAKLLEQLQLLLMEVTTTDAPRRVDDDQDHA